jgi:ABC-2 type transport system ATP-binding protein
VRQEARDQRNPGLAEKEEVEMAIVEQGEHPAEAADVSIWTKGLTRAFDDEIAVNDVTMTVPSGKIFGFIGPSGSGKTTTIRLLTGVYEPTSGDLSVLGRDPALFDQATRDRIGYMPQLFVLYPELSVWENLNFAASLYGMPLRRKRRLQEVLEFVELYDARGKLVRNVSGGMRRRLSLAATMVHEPELIFLDEPTAGIDPVLRRKFWERFRALQTRGRTLFITTQYVGEAAYCDLVGVLAKGRLLALDTPEQLRYRAFGGDIVDLMSEDRLTYQHRQALSLLPYVRKDVERVDDSHVRLTVDEAATAVPRLIEWCRAKDVPVRAVEEYLPPFDDVFVQIVEEAPENG